MEAGNRKGESQTILDALDALGVALVGHGHRWTRRQRAAYEKAVRCLGKRQLSCRSLKG